MTKVLLLSAFLLLAWLGAGRQITLALDRFPRLAAAPLAVSPLQYDGGGFVIGDKNMLFGSIDNLPYALRLSGDSSSRIVLSTGRDAFTLGPRTSPVDPAGRPDINFTPEPGDDVRFSTWTSVLSWPTPFEIHILGGASPWWKRYVYYRLVWKKRSAAKLEMLWRYEQRWYSARGWSAPAMMWNSQTGLLSVKIQPEAEGELGAVVAYIARIKGWHRGDYRIEKRGPSADGRTEVFSVVHLEDERGGQPGAGKSIELVLETGSHRVVKESGAQ